MVANDDGTAHHRAFDALRPLHGVGGRVDLNAGATQYVSADGDPVAVQNDAVEVNEGTRAYGDVRAVVTPERRLDSNGIAH